jgi:hypothetical protein
MGEEINADTRSFMHFCTKDEEAVLAFSEAF